MKEINTKSTLYSKRIDNKEAFRNQIFNLFTDACGGDSGKFADILYNRFTIEDFGFSDDSKYWEVYGYFRDKVIPHKIAVYQSGIELSRTDVFKNKSESKALFMENLWIHDMSKFSANESFGYAFHDFKSKNYDLQFEKAWHHHKQHNPHHPEYWLNPNRKGEFDMIPMPEIYVIEMVADWMGAGKTYGNSLEDWLPDNLHKFKWHHLTAISVSMVLKNIGVETKIENDTLYI